MEFSSIEVSPKIVETLARILLDLGDSIAYSISLQRLMPEHREMTLSIILLIPSFTKLDNTIIVSQDVPSATFVNSDNDTIN